MNIALGGLILLVILTPGLTFRLALIKSESFENPLDTSRTAEIIFIIIPAIVFNIIFVHLSNQYSSYTVNFDQLYYILSGDSRTSDNIIGASVIPFTYFIVYSFCFNLSYWQHLKVYYIKILFGFQIPYFRDFK